MVLMWWRIAVGFVVLASLVVVAAGCRDESNINMYNYKQIEPGMTLQQVNALLGCQPSKTDGEGNYAWFARDGRDGMVTVLIMDGIVVDAYEYGLIGSE
jgi:hypothetical protein